MNPISGSSLFASQSVESRMSCSCTADGRSSYEDQTASTPSFAALFKAVRMLFALFPRVVNVVGSTTASRATSVLRKPFDARRRRVGSCTE